MDYLQSLTDLNPQIAIGKPLRPDPERLIHRLVNPLPPIEEECIPWQRLFLETLSSYHSHFRRHCCICYFSIYYYVVTYAWYLEFVRRVEYLVSTFVSGFLCEQPV